MAEPRAGRRRPRGALALLAVLVLALAGLESALHLFPGLLPESLLERYPLRGIEFFRPGVLAETPIDELAFPLRRPYRGPPPADLVALGLAPASADVDRRTTPEVHYLADARGLPNASIPARAHTLFVGDSFLVAAAGTEPPGLVAGYVEATGHSVYDLAVAGIGPRHELWLLDEVGLALEPELVVWFFFAGNDLTDEKSLAELEAAGVRTHADKPDYRPPPTWRLPALLARPAPSTRNATPLPGFRLTGAAGDVRTWFLPDNFWRLALGLEAWRGHRGWPSARDALGRAAERTRATGARLALVYLPSKEEVLLPHVELDARGVEDLLALGGELPPGHEAEEVLRRARANRNACEALIAGFCEERGIPFFSAREALEEGAARGELVYLATDTHWSSSGQRAVLAPLLGFLESLDGCGEGGKGEAE